MSEAWTDYIDKCDRATVRACMAAVGEVIGKDVVNAAPTLNANLAK